MTYKSLIKTLLYLPIVLLAGMALPACSSDEPEGEDLSEKVIGAWQDTEDPGFFVVFNANYTFETYEESEDYPGKYADKYEGIWAVNGSRILCSFPDKEFEASLKNDMLICFDETYKRCSMSDVPTQKAPTGGSSTGTTDALTGTSWKLTKMTGWAVDPDWYGERLSFQSNGRVTEYYAEGGSGSGTYSISGSTLTLNGIAMVNYFGPKYSFSKTSSKLTLTADKGTNMETTFIFDKY